MKRLALLTAVTLFTLDAFGQGTVTFLNDTATLSTPPDRYIRWGVGNSGIIPGTPAYGTNCMVQLYYGTSGSAESALIPLSAGPARLRVSTSSAIGTWQNGGSRTFQTAGPGAQLTLQVRLWDIYFGATYEQAMLNGGLLAKSALFGYVVPQASDPPAAFLMSNFAGFSIDNICPEPSSCTLAIFGTVVLLLRRRKSAAS